MFEMCDIVVDAHRRHVLLGLGCHLSLHGVHLVVLHVDAVVPADVVLEVLNV